MPRFRFLLICLLGSLFAANSFAQSPDTRLRVASPDGQIVFILGDAKASQALEPGVNDLRYAVDFHGKWLMDESVLGLKLEGQSELGPGMNQVSVQTGQHDETYTIPVGKTSSVRDHYNSALVDLADDSGRKLMIEVRVFNDGAAFRYVVPEQPSIQKVRIEHELTQFNYNKDATLYPLILDGFQTPYEDEYQVRQVSGIHRDWLIGLPLLAEVSGIGWVAVTEADIDNYAGMYLRKGTHRHLVFALSCHLASTHPTLRSKPMRQSTRHGAC
jgi:alpha-glucosidase